MNVKKSLSMSRGNSNTRKRGIEENIANNLLKPNNNHTSSGKINDLQLNGVNLFSGSANQQDEDEVDPRDEYWRKNFINFGQWKKEDQAISKNKKIPRQSSRTKINLLPQGDK